MKEKWGFLLPINEGEKKNQKIFLLQKIILTSNPLFLKIFRNKKPLPEKLELRKRQSSIIYYLN
jgi:hypothetical protein